MGFREQSSRSQAIKKEILGEDSDEEDGEDDDDDDDDEDEEEGGVAQGGGAPGAGPIKARPLPILPPYSSSGARVQPQILAFKAMPAEAWFALISTAPTLDATAPELCSCRACCVRLPQRHDADKPHSCSDML